MNNDEINIHVKDINNHSLYINCNSYKPWHKKLQTLRQFMIGFIKYVEMPICSRNE